MITNKRFSNVGLKLSIFLLTTGLTAAALTACNQEPTISVSPTSLLDDLTQPNSTFTPVTRDQMLSSITEGNLISVGESHEQGLERNYIAQFYSDLSTRLSPLPVQCLVETAGLVNSSDGETQKVSLIPSSGNDPVMPQFTKVCPPQ